jgi:hypothetical protein
MMEFPQKTIGQIIDSEREPKGSTMATSLTPNGFR